MVHHVLTRTALYATVWSEPIRTVARRLAVSDVGLAKACRVAGVPVPPRGYWSQVKHGQPTPPRPPLPPRPGGEQVVIAPPKRHPPAPAAAAAEAEAIPVPGDLRRAHPIVRGWIAEDAATRRRFRREGWSLEGLADLSAPLAQRRLRITSALLKALERCQREVACGPGGLTVTAHGETLAFTLYERSKVQSRPATAEEHRWRPERQVVRATVPAGDLVCKIREPLSAPTEFKEIKTPLEAQLPAIVARLEAGLAELAERRRLRALEAERRAAAETAREKRLAYREAQSALSARLVAQAERHQQAQAIRAYVAAADGSAAAAAADYAAWRTWALDQAEAMDPLLDGSAPFARLPPLEDWTPPGR
nr:hypothetical protein [Brevundimonas diminuta]